MTSAQHTKNELEEHQKAEKMKAKLARESLMFNIGSLALMSVLGPLLYYSIQINHYGHSNKPEGLFFPSPWLSLHERSMEFLKPMIDLIMNRLDLECIRIAGEEHYIDCDELVSLIKVYRSRVL